MSKGITRSPSNYRRIKSGGRGGSYGGHTQSTLHSYRKADLDYTLLVLKEVGKAVYPPAALAIEVLYQLYVHSDDIKNVGSAILDGNYEKAAVIVGTVVVKEVAKTAMGAAEGPIITPASDSLAHTAAQNIEGSAEEKVIAGNAVKGTVSGVVKAANKKVVDKATDEVLKWKEEQQN